jgi:hypothetical protein
MNKFDKTKVTKAREIYVCWCMTASVVSDGMVSLLMYEVSDKIKGTINRQIRNQVVFPVIDHIFMRWEIDTQIKDQLHWRVYYQVEQKILTMELFDEL